MKFWAKILFPVVFLSCFNISSAQLIQQDSIVRVSGRILNQEKQPIPYVSIFDKKTVHGTMTDSSGYFTIVINRRDTLSISALGYKPAKLAVPDSIKSNMYFFNLSLDTRTYMLKTVHVYGLTKKEQFKKDFKEHNTELTVEEKNVFKNFPDYQKESKIQPSDLQPGVKIDGPISALYDAFSKEGKSKRKYAELVKEDNLHDRLEKRFNKELVSSITGFKGDTVEDFMKFCRFGTSFILNATEYDFYLAIKKRLEQYKKLKGLS